MADASVAGSAEEYWEERYRNKDISWSGRPNMLLVREVASLTPGAALDLGCGEGADAVWLASQGWRVTAVDVSATALRRGAVAAAEAGVADMIEWQRHDLSRSFPEGRFDLVSAQFLHSAVAAEDERPAILRQATRAVAPGGVLLIVGHVGWPSWVSEPPFDYHFPTTSEVLDQLHLPPSEWRVEVEEQVVHEINHDGHSGTREDNVLKLRRAPA